MGGEVVGVPIRPLHERVRDYALVSGGGGAVVGATLAAARGGQLLHGATWVGGYWALAASVFVSLRHAILQERWQEDREAVSGIAAATVGAGATTLSGAQRRTVAQTAFLCFLGGFTLHYFHRWWLRARLDWAES